MSVKIQIFLVRVHFSCSTLTYLTLFGEKNWENFRIFSPIFDAENLFFRNLEMNLTWSRKIGGH